MAVGADRIVVYGSNEICSFQYSHGRFGKNALRKEHYPVMSKTGGSFMLVHSFKRLSCFCVKMFGIVAPKLCSRMRAARHRDSVISRGLSETPRDARIASAPAP